MFGFRKNSAQHILNTVFIFVSLLVKQKYSEKKSNLCVVWVSTVFVRDISNTLVEHSTKVEGNRTLMLLNKSSFAFFQQGRGYYEWTQNFCEYFLVTKEYSNFCQLTMTIVVTLKSYIWSLVMWWVMDIFGAEMLSGFLLAIFNHSNFG